MTDDPKRPEPQLPRPEDAPLDPLLQRVIAQALAPYERHASPALLQEMRALLEDYLVTHPYPAGLYRQLRARAPVNESSEVPRAWPEPTEAPPTAGDDAETGAARSGRRSGR
ncbi:hypothetical protein [Chondromyces crocatus]|uniref:Uncharacterized protein n=1 Tax=Chondromyces crocatus TaxID=52 RepID=A0A0K1EAG8_CHOCO|nr:hypothetical protein [Chondromyces crocatus]AKT37881.1 uncharacterized protein CMC5_020240 [Chondromyces crocatus]